MKLRTVIFWPHLIAGVIAGIVILIMSVTGVLLTYERQLIKWSDSHLRSAPPQPGAPKLPVETLLDTLRRDHPALAPTAITIGSAPDAAVTVAVPERTLYVDAYSGSVLGEGAQGVRRVMSDLRAWHRWLAVAGDGRPAARAITGWSNLLFLFIVASGAYLWLPRKWSWQRLRPVVLFKGGLRGKARDFNWHNVIGLWSAVPLFIVVLSAVPISFRWASDLVYVAVGEQPPAAAGRGAAGGREGGPAGARAGGAGRGGGREAGAAGGERTASRPQPERPPAAEGQAGRASEVRERGDGREGAGVSFAGLNALVARAERQVPGWRSINLRIPDSPRAPIAFAIDKGDGGQPHLRSTLTLNRTSGDVVSYESFSSLTLGRRIRNVMRFAHTGEVLGIPGQTIAGLVSAGAVVLVWTGMALALRRFVAWAKRRRGAQAVDTRQSTAA
jgi:uncharacterized iron-regulated membrane protein